MVESWKAIITWLEQVLCSGAVLSDILQHMQITINGNTLGVFSLLTAAGIEFLVVVAVAKWLF